MKVILLTLDNIEEDIKQEIKGMLPSKEEDEERELRRIISGDDERNDLPTTLFIDTTKLYKETEYFFRIESVKGLYLSPLQYRENPMMIILLNDREYNCKFDSDIYNKLKEHLNNY